MTPLTLSVGIVALLLLAINAAGWFIRRRRWSQSAASTPRAISQLLDVLPAQANAAPGNFCTALNEALGDRFEHGYARCRFVDNYAVWLAGCLLPRLRDIQDTSLLLRDSPTALCSQLSQVFVDAATRAGLIARIVALPGHVVVEVFYDDAWHGYDSDYGVEFRTPVGDVISVQELSARPEMAERIYAEHRLPRSNAEVLSILQRQEFTALLPGAHAVPRVAAFQCACERFKWWLPAIALLLCLGSLLF